MSDAARAKPEAVFYAVGHQETPCIFGGVRCIVCDEQNLTAATFLDLEHDRDCAVLKLRTALADQAAALREDNARLRGLIIKSLSDVSEALSYFEDAFEDDEQGPEWATHAERILRGLHRALLADPEGQAHE